MAIKTTTRALVLSFSAISGPHIGATTLGGRFSLLATGAGPCGRPEEIGFGAISEVVFKDDNALAEMAKISGANRDRIVEDEARWFHQKRSWMVTCETMEEDLSPRWK